MLALSSDKDQRKTSFRFRCNINDPLQCEKVELGFLYITAKAIFIFLSLWLLNVDIKQDSL